MFKRFGRKSLGATIAALMAALGVGGIAVAQNSGSTPAPAAPSTQAAPAGTPQTAGDKADTGTEAADAPDGPGDKADSGTDAQDGPGDKSDAPDGPGDKGESGSETPDGDGPGGHADEAPAATPAQ